MTETGKIKKKVDPFLKKQEGQFDTLIAILTDLKRYFSPIFLSALKKADGRKLEIEEQKRMDDCPEATELIERLGGLIGRFGTMFNQALVQIGEEYMVAVKGETLKREEERNRTDDGQSSPRKRVPKGYSLWDLKKVKLHESGIEGGRKIWVGFWTLRGHSGIGEFVINERKNILYFRPHPTSNAEIFPLVLEEGRVLSRQGKSYYFKVVDDPMTLPI